MTRGAVEWPWAVAVVGRDGEVTMTVTTSPLHNNGPDETMATAWPRTPRRTCMLTTLATARTADLPLTTVEVRVTRCRWVCTTCESLSTCTSQRWVYRTHD